MRQSANRSYFAWKTRAIRDTPPLPCAPGAACAIHTMLSQRDVPMYLVAIKSLLRFCPHVSVVVHSDGSLNDEAVADIGRHIPGMTVIGRDEADERARKVLGPDSYLFRWRRHDASWRRVIDTELWCAAPKRIIIDPDVVVIRRPEQLVEWIDNGTGAFLFGQPPTDRDPSATAPPGFIQTLFRQRAGALDRRMGLEAAFPQGATSGFYGCERELPLTLIEQVLRAGEAEGLPMAQWGSEQCTVIFLLQAARAMRLDARHYLNYDPTCEPLIPDARVVHFYGTYRYHHRLYPRLGSDVARALIDGPASARP